MLEAGTSKYLYSETPHRDPPAKIKKMAKQVMDLMPTKGITVAQSNEHLRNFSAEAYRRKLSYAFDPTREHLNFEVRKGGVIVPVDKQLSIPNESKTI